MFKKRFGFTLVEMLIVIAILGILVAIATPLYVRYATTARRSACITNLKKIEAAVMLARLSGVSDPTAADIIGPDHELKKMPSCPINRQFYTELDPPLCPAGDPTHVIPPRN